MKPVRGKNPGERTNEREFGRKLQIKVFS